MSNEKKLHFETLQLHVGQEQADPTTDSRAVPIYQTTSYVFHNAQHAADRFGLRDAGNIYGRLTNSTQAVFEQRVAALEGGVAGLALASGAAAITYALQNVAQNGDHILAANNLYGGTTNLLAHTLTTQGIEVSFVNPSDFEQVEAGFRHNTKAVIIETFGNPNASVTDIDKISEIAHRHHVPVIVDNTFGTPYLLRPIEHGADVVVHSATKFIGGHGSSLGGVIVDSGKFDWKADADKYQVQKNAEADLEQRKRIAEAQRYEAEQKAQAQNAASDATRYQLEQEAQGIKAKGEAEAYAILKRGEAEAQAMDKKAEAYKKYNNAAVAQMMIEVLPQIVENVAKPISAIKDVNIYSGDGQGISAMSGNVPVAIKQAFDVLKSATGVDMADIMKAGSIQAKTTRNINLNPEAQEIADGLKDE